MATFVSPQGGHYRDVPTVNRYPDVVGKYAKVYYFFLGFLVLL